MHLANNSNDGGRPLRDRSLNCKQAILRSMFSRCTEGLLTAFLRERETNEDQIPHLLTEILDEAVKQFPSWVKQVALICHLTLHYRNDVHGFLNGLVRDRQAADDLTQDTFINAMIAIRKGSFVPPASKTKAWLLMIGTNLVRDAVRKSKARRECSLDGVNETTLVAKQTCLDAKLDLNEALDKVKSWCGSRAVEIAKLVQDGCNKEEIAARQDVSTRTVERRLQTLAAALRRITGRSV
jgi:RNA polymerase sigma factor (sigma-70 family)